MKQITLTICAATLLFAACNNDKKEDKDKMGKDTTQTTTTKPEETTQPAQPMDTAAMNKAMRDYGTPGDMHKMLANTNGNWTEEITFWMDPSAPAQKMTATCTNKMILNGLYQQSVHKGMFNNMPFEGWGTVGYDNAKKMFVSSWVDNMGSGIMNMTGAWDQATKTINLSGKETDPMTGKDMDARQTMTLTDDNTQKMEMFLTQGGKEMKTMEISFKRKK